MLKNTSLDTIEVNYKLPETSFFSMPFPEYKRLSPGMFTKVNVVFRPVRLEPYDDTIEFLVRNQSQVRSFYIRVASELSATKVELPSSLDFGFCAVNELSERPVVLKNTGQTTVTFEWAVDLPFNMTPRKGTVAAGKGIEFVASVMPQAAEVLVTSIACKIGGEKALPFKMSCIGKYTFLSLSEVRANFGTRPPGKAGRTEKELWLRNHATVAASFRIKQEPSELCKVFSVEPEDYVVPANGSIKLTVRYMPFCTKSFSCSYFSISTPGGNTVRLQCVGACEASELALVSRGSSKGRTAVLEFGECKLYENNPDKQEKVVFPVKVLTLKNTGDCTLSFSFHAHADCVYTFLDKAYGQIPPGVERSLRVQFCPTRVGNYYRKLFCLVNDSVPCSVELLGTAYDPEDKHGNRPFPFTYKHVLIQKQREKRGIGSFSAEKIARLNLTLPDPPVNAIVAEPDLSISRSGRFNVSELETLGGLFHMADKYTPQEMLEQYKPIVTSTENVDFGCCGSGDRGVQQVFKVTNNTEAKVTCAWSVSCARDRQDTYEVVPSVADISPNRSLAFTVYFRPKVDNCFYHAQLHAQVYHKCNRSFKLVKEETFVPPWSLLINIDGNTFPSGDACFIPKAAFKAHSVPHAKETRSNVQRLEFPPCYVGDVVYQSLIIENTGNTPIRFSWLKRKQECDLFAVQPSSGFLRVGEFQVIMLRFKHESKGEMDVSLANSMVKSSVSVFEELITCRLNENPTYDHVLHLKGYTCKPSLALYDMYEPDVLQTSVHIQPTSLGAVAERKMIIHNTSHVPLMFAWSIPKSFRDVLRVSPSKALLRGNEFAELVWEFRPLEAKTYRVETHCTGRSSDGEERVLKFPFVVVGESTAPALTFESSKVELKPTLVKQPAPGQLRLINTSNSLIRYSMRVAVACRAPEPPRDTNHDAQGISKPISIPLSTLRCEQYEGSVHGRSSTSIPLVFAPTHAGLHEFKVCCEVLDGVHMPTEDDDFTSESISCVVTAEATYPRLRIEDARCVDVSTQELWTQFNVARVNECLFATMKDIQVPLKFTPKPQGSRGQTVLLLLRNNGNLPASFKLRFPNDMDVELEPWADEKEPSEEDVKTNFVLDAGLFEVEPRTGLIEPGDAQTIRFTYHYLSTNFNGRHTIPVHLNLENGAQIQLLFMGKTLTNQEQLVFIPKDEYELEPMPIGLTHPLEQEIEIKNPCDEDIHYELDESSLDRLKRNNHDFPVLRCLNTSGLITARSTLALRWVFQPIEHKELCANVQIRFRGPNGQGPETKADAELEPPLEEEIETRAVPLDVVKQLKIVGKGYHPREASTFFEAHGRKSDIGTRPFYQRLQVPNQLASFSMEKLDFGDLTNGSLSRRFTVLHNHLAVPIEFSWDVQQPLVLAGILIVEPMHGVIQPGKFATSRLTFKAGADTACQVVHSRLECLVSVANRGVSSEEELKAKLGRSVSRASTFVRRDEKKSPTKSTDQSSVVGKMTVARSERIKSTKGSAVLASDARVETASRARTTYSLFSSVSTKPFSVKSKPASTKRTSELLYVHIDGRIVHNEDYPSTTAFQPEGPADLQRNERQGEASKVKADPLFIELAKGSTVEPYPEVKTDNRCSWVMLPECRTNVERVVDNTVYNILVEALHKEISLGSAKRIFNLYKASESKAPEKSSVRVDST